jgi:uncharacterized C2H2 Zn-finger protein
MNVADFDKLSDEEKEHFFRCPECGEVVDKRELRDVIFHATGHKPKRHRATIKGKPIPNLLPVIRIAIEMFCLPNDSQPSVRHREILRAFMTTTP